MTALVNPTTKNSLFLTGDTGIDWTTFIAEAGTATTDCLATDIRVALASELSLTPVSAYSLQDLWNRYRLAGYPDPAL